MITSLNNAKVKHLNELQNKSKLRNREGLFIAEGIRLFQEVPEGLIKEVYIDEQLDRQIHSKNIEPDKRVKAVGAKLDKLIKAGRYVEVLSKEVFKKAADTDTPQGILAVCRMPEFTLRDILDNMPKGSKGNILILEDIQDPGNLGTMLRTAEAAGVSGIIMSKKTVDIYSPKVVRSTMGALFRMPHFYAEDFLKTIDELKDFGIKIYALHLSGTASYNEIKYKGRCGLMIGNEGNGLSDEVTAKSDNRVIIPMLGKTESLNASVAAALIMYQAQFS